MTDETKSGLSRRTMLKGLGVTLALPLLDAMAPAALAKGQAGSAAAKKVRLVAMSLDGTAVFDFKHQSSHSRPP